MLQVFGMVCFITTGASRNLEPFQISTFKVNTATHSVTPSIPNQRVSLKKQNVFAYCVADSSSRVVTGTTSVVDSSLKAQTGTPIQALALRRWQVEFDKQDEHSSVRH